MLKYCLLYTSLYCERKTYARTSAIIIYFAKVAYEIEIFFVSCTYIPIFPAYRKINTGDNEEMVRIRRLISSIFSFLPFSETLEEYENNSEVFIFYILQNHYRIYFCQVLQMLIIICAK